MLEITELNVAYGPRRALDRVSLVVAPGEIVALLGANGSGKSTTLRAISGLVRATGGTIRWDGHDLERLTADAIVGRGIGHVPEGREIFAEFTVHENLLVGGHKFPRGRWRSGWRPRTDSSRF
jgi:branched-chain amino acid transport system ATP-binding protein